MTEKVAIGEGFALVREVREDGTLVVESYTDVEHLGKSCNLDMLLMPTGTEGVYSIAYQVEDGELFTTSHKFDFREEFEFYKTVDTWDEIVPDLFKEIDNTDEFDMSNASIR